MIIFQQVKKTPPVKIQTIQTESKGSMRGLAFDRKQNRIFSTCFEDGRIYGYETGSHWKKGISQSQVMCILGQKGARDIVYIDSTDQIAIGYDTGIIVFYDVSNFQNPFFSRKIHSDNITSVKYYIENDQIVSSSKDQTVKVWSLSHSNPKQAQVKRKSFKKNTQSEFPFNEDLDQIDSQETKEIKVEQIQKKPEVIKQPVKITKKEESESSSEDDLAGWNDQLMKIKNQL